MSEIGLISFSRVSKIGNKCGFKLWVKQVSSFTEMIIK